MAKLKFLSDADAAILRRDYDRTRRRETPGSQYSEDQVYYTPDVYFVKVPEEGLTARDVDNKLTGVECDVYGPQFDDEDNLVLKKIPGFTLKVYNPFKVKWYGSGIEEKCPLIEIRREKQGYWFCEKPPYRLKAKPVANIDPGQEGTVRLNLYGVSTTEELKATLNWMSGGEKISAGRETIIEYRDDEDKFIFVEAECETTT